MKKVLFVLEALDLNGATVSFLNLLNCIDRRDLEISLLLFKNEGVLMSDLPTFVKIMPENPILRGFLLPIKEGVFFFLKQRNITLAFKRLLVPLHRYLINNGRERDLAWEQVPEVCGFDLAIGFTPGLAHRFVIEKVKAQKKCGWIHSEVARDIQEGTRFLQSMDRLVVVSGSTYAYLLKHLPGVESQTLVIPNAVNRERVLALSEMATDVFLRKDRINLVMVGRLGFEKGSDLIIPVAKELKRKGVLFTWWIIGKGVLLSVLQESVLCESLEDEVVFLGEKQNPYPFMRGADIYIQLSRSEAWGLSVTEAKILGVPIVASDIPAFRLQIEQGQTGYLVEPIPEVFAASIALLANDSGRRKRCKENLQKFVADDAETRNMFAQLVKRA